MNYIIPFLSIYFLASCSHFYKNDRVPSSQFRDYSNRTLSHIKARCFDSKTGKHIRVKVDRGLLKDEQCISAGYEPKRTSLRTHIQDATGKVADGAQRIHKNATKNLHLKNHFRCDEQDTKGRRVIIYRTESKVTSNISRGLLNDPKCEFITKEEYDRETN